MSLLLDLDAILERKLNRRRTFILSPFTAVTQADSDIEDLVKEVKRLRIELGWLETMNPGLPNQV